MSTADQEALIRHFEFLLYKAEYGLALPYSREDVRHYERLIAEARRAQPDDPGVVLARKLASNYLDGLDWEETPMNTIRPITLDIALRMLVAANLLRIEQRTIDGQTIDAYVPTAEGRRRWFGEREEAQS